LRERTVVAGIMRLVEQAQQSRSRAQLSPIALRSS